MTHSLHIKLVEGHNLIAADADGFSDPYAKITIANVTLKTKTIKKTLNPKWNETFAFDGIPLKSACNIRVKDWDRFSRDDFLGSIDIDLSGYANGKPKSKWFPLQYYDNEKGSVSAGEVLIVLQVVPKGQKHSLDTIPVTPTLGRRNTFTEDGNGQLILEVVAGRSLPVKDVTGSSDPYCKIKVGEQESKTNIMEKNLDPVWNEEFYFKVSPQLAYFSIKMFDWDMIGKDDPMGMIRISFSELADECLHDDWWQLKPQKAEKVSGYIHLRVQFTSAKNSQKYAVISKDNYLSLSLVATKHVTLVANLMRLYQSHEFSRALVHLFNDDKKILPLLNELFSSDIGSAPDENNIFCGDTAATRAVHEYFKWTNRQCGYLKTCVLPIVNFVNENPTVFEIDPQRKPSPNPKHLQDAAQRMLNLVFNTPVPGPFREVLSALRRQVVAAFPKSELKVINDIFFLRFICSAIFIPEKFGLLQEPPNPVQRRALMLVAKIIHNAANGELFAKDEELLVPFNSLIYQNTAKFVQHIDTLTRYPTDEDKITSYPVQYTESKKLHYMAIAVQHLYNNFGNLKTGMLSTKEFSHDPAKTAEAKLYFDELAVIFGKYVS